MTMSPLLAALICIAAYVAAYRVYARFLAERVFAIDPARPTPAVRYRDEVDYVPANRYVLFGHQYASITGLSPMLGPAIAVIWGWLPAMLWVVIGAIFVGAVHDFGALVVSIRARGMSLGKVTENLVGQRGKTLFHLVIFFLIALAMGVFVHVIAVLFSPDFYPEAVLPSSALVFVAAGMGVAVHRGGWSIRGLTVAGLAVALALAFLGIRHPVVGPSLAQWKWLLLAYSFGASVLPVWLLLQPRDYINSLLLYAGVGAMYLGFVATNPSFVAPAVDLAPEGAPPIVPFVFVVIACGAASGFHALMSSGSTAKQLATEGDARFVGYGAMIGESLLGLMAVLACTAGFVSREAWLERYVSWQAADSLGNNIAAFIRGTTHFLQTLGIPEAVGGTFVAVIVVSFALTSLDSATRLLRYNVSEMGDTLGVGALSNRYVASGIAVIAIWAFAFIQVDGEFAGLILWQLFGTTNQLLAGLALLAVTLYLLRRGRPLVYTAAPMVFMLLSTLTVMSTNLADFWSAGLAAAGPRRDHLHAGGVAGSGGRAGRRPLSPEPSAGRAGGGVPGEVSDRLQRVSAITFE